MSNNIHDWFLITPSSETAKGTFSSNKWRCKFHNVMYYVFSVHNKLILKTFITKLGTTSFYLFLQFYLILSIFGQLITNHAGFILNICRSYGRKWRMKKTKQNKTKKKMKNEKCFSSYEHLNNLFRIPRLGPAQWNYYLKTNYCIISASLMAQCVKNLPAMQETQETQV